MAVAPGQGILAHSNAGGSIDAYVNLREEWLAADQPSAIARIATLFSGWVPSLRALITYGEKVPVVRPIYALPPLRCSPRVRGVTLLGDRRRAPHVSVHVGGRQSRDARWSRGRVRVIDHHGDTEGALAINEQHPGDELGQLIQPPFLRAPVEL